MNKQLVNKWISWVWKRWIWVYLVFSEPNFIQSSKNYRAQNTCNCLWKQKLMKLHILFFNRNFKSQNLKSEWNSKYYCSCYSVYNYLLSNLLIISTCIKYFLWIALNRIIIFAFFLFINFFILIIFFSDRIIWCILVIIGYIWKSYWKILPFLLLILSESVFYFLIIIIIFSQQNLMIIIVLLIVFLFLVIFNIIEDTFCFHNY